MRTAYRGLLAGALGLPLMLGVPGVALAGDYDGHHKDKGDHKQECRHEKKCDDNGKHKDCDSDKKCDDDGHKGDKGDDGEEKWMKHFPEWLWKHYGQMQPGDGGVAGQMNSNATAVQQISFVSEGDTEQTVENVTVQTNKNKKEKNQQSGEESDDSKHKKH